MRTDSFGHASLSRAHRKWRTVGEVIAFKAGWHRRGAWAFRAWRNSPGHLGVLLDSRARSIGAGRTRGHYGGGRATIWTLRVGRR